MTTSSSSVLVVSRYTPQCLAIDSDGNPYLDDPLDKRNDLLDDFNHPRIRRATILHKLTNAQNTNKIVLNDDDEVDDTTAMNNTKTKIIFTKPSKQCNDLYAYENIHSKGLVEFLSTAWDRWDRLGENGQDLTSCMHWVVVDSNDDDETETTIKHMSPPLIPGNFILPRYKNQRPSRNVMGEIGYYCTDTFTPIIQNLKDELLWDLAVLKHTVMNCHNFMGVYALTTHPGHHAAEDSFGGYCYVNHASFIARHLQEQFDHISNVAILDIDYHCGDGTSSIFYSDASVLVISIHCHPDYEYPFHSGFEDETGIDDGKGATIHLPLPPGTGWKEYKIALEAALQSTIENFTAQALVVSLGLDTYDGDPCAIKRAGFRLKGHDYFEMGRLIGNHIEQLKEQQNHHIPTIFVQEGGYKMDKVPQAVADVLLGYIHDTSDESVRPVST